MAGDFNSRASRDNWTGKDEEEEEDEGEEGGCRRSYRAWLG